MSIEHTSTQSSFDTSPPYHGDHKPSKAFHNQTQPNADNVNVNTTVGTSIAVSVKGDRRRTSQPVKKGSTFLVPRVLDVTPGPNVYNLQDNKGLGKTGYAVSFKGFRVDPFKPNVDPLDINPHYHGFWEAKNAFKYAPVPPKATTEGVTMKGDRRHIFNEAKGTNAIFLLPQLVDTNPGPGAYDIAPQWGRRVIETALLGKPKVFKTYQRPFISDEIFVNQGQRSEEDFRIPDAEGYHRYVPTQMEEFYTQKLNKIKQSRQLAVSLKGRQLPSRGKMFVP